MTFPPTPSAAPTVPAQPSVRTQLLLPFLAYFLMLASTSFIAGGIVHLGLGENPTFYMSLAVVGVVCFTIGNYLQEYVIRKNERGTGIAKFLLVSFVLSVGMGMMTGGVQHFLDNPPYSTILIPVGLLLAVGAFAVREGLPLGRKVTRLIGGTAGVALLLFGGLNALAQAVDTPSAHAHGAAEEVAPPSVPVTVPSTSSSAPKTVKSASGVTPVKAGPAGTSAAEEHEDGHADH